VRQRRLRLADNSTARRVTFAGYAATHDAKYDGGVLHGMAEAGIKRPLLGGTIEPIAGIEAYHVRSDAFAETGTTTALVARAKRGTFTLADVGMRADTPIVAGYSDFIGDNGADDNRLRLTASLGF
jgi:uncharacterized protein with beta-barrel porin domain